MTVKERAIAMLDRRDYSRRELIDRLVEKGENAEEAEAVADRFVELGIIDDSRYSKLIARHYAAKGYGAGRVKTELMKRGIDRELWDEALEQMPPQDDTVDRLLRSKLRSRQPDRAEIKKAADALARRGYNWDQIKSAIDRFCDE